MLAKIYFTILTLASYTVLEGFRQRLLSLLVAVITISLLIAEFAGMLAITEAQLIRSSLLGALLRFLGVLLVILHVLYCQAREESDKGLELLFSLPISRSLYFFGKLVGYLVLVLGMVCLFMLTLLLFAPPAQVALWGYSLFLELWIVVTMSFLAQLTLRKVPVAFLTVLLFYLLSRTMSSLQVVGQGAIMPQNSASLTFSNILLDTIAALLPSLDRFTQSAWLAYGQGGWDDVWLISVQSGAYIVLLFGAVLIDLQRKSL